MRRYNHDKTMQTFNHVKISADRTSFLALATALIASYFIVKEAFIWAAAFFAIAIIFDKISGLAAHVSKKAACSAYIGAVAGKYLEGIIVFGLLFAFLPGFLIPAYVWALLLVFGSIMASYAKAAAKEAGLQYKEKRGLLEKKERLVILLIGIAIAAYNPLYLTYALAMLAVLANITALQKIRMAVSMHEKFHLKIIRRK